MYDKNRFIKKYATILIIIILVVIGICGVRIRSVNQHNKADDNEQQSTTVSNKSEKDDNLSSDNSKTEAEITQASKDINEIADDNIGDEISDEISKEISKETDSQLNKSDIDSSDTSNTSQETMGDNGGSNNDNALIDSGNSDYITCYVEIRCDKAVPYKREISNIGVRNSIPDNGQILGKMALSVNKNSSVYEVLISTAKANGLQVGYNSSMYGKYITSIANLEEKAVTQSSGWTYFVNGTFAQTSASSCRINDQDYILWDYVTEYN